MSELTRVLADVSAVDQIVTDYFHHNKVVNLARKLQVALLAVATLSVKPSKVKLVDGLTQEEVDFATDPTGKIRAIKAVRERTGLGLYDAKVKVETWQDKHPELMKPAPAPTW